MSNIRAVEKSTSAAKPQTFAVDTNLQITSENLNAAEKRVAAAINKPTATPERSGSRVIMDAALGNNPIHEAGALMDRAETPVQWAAGAFVGAVGFLRVAVGLTAQKVESAASVVQNGPSTPPDAAAQKAHQAIDNARTLSNGTTAGQALRDGVDQLRDEWIK